MLVLEIKDPKLSIKVASVQLGLPPNARIIGSGKASNVKPLTITVVVENLDRTKKISIHPWGTAALATLKDEHGNDYRETVPESTAIRSIYPDTPHQELLVFEPPLEAAKTLYLELPATVFGGKGTLRFELPRSMITVAEPQPVEAPKAEPFDPYAPQPLENAEQPRRK